MYAERCSRMLPGFWGICNRGLMNQAPTRLRFVWATHRACRGAEPLCVFSIPQEWGIKGVENGS
jgi:hypothetical protein